MRIHIATDGSDHSDRAVRLVASMSWPAGTVFRIVSVVDDPTAAFAAVPNELIQAELKERLDGVVAGAAKHLPGDTVERAVLRGRAAPAILEDAEVYGADAIVVGHRGQSPVAALLLGSVAAEVVEKARVPVLVARTYSMGTIVLGDDGSPQARAAREVVAAWPGLSWAPVRVVSVARVTAPLSSGVTPTMRRAASVAYAGDLTATLARHYAIADEAAAELRRHDLAATASAAKGDPATEILAVADEVNAQLIVVGSRGQGGIAALLGSVARAVVLRARCSVLVVHEGTAPIAPKEAKT